MTTTTKVSRSEVFTISEAAELCGVSEDTIKRDLRDQRYPNAAKQMRGKMEVWQIPGADLVAAGRLGSEVVSGRARLQDLGYAEQVQVLTVRVRELETQLSVAQTQAQERANIIAALINGTVIRSAAVTS